MADHQRDPRQGVQREGTVGHKQGTRGQDPSHDQTGGPAEHDRTQAIQQEEQERNRENQADDVGGPPNSRE